ncbi:MAG: ECF transporter S component [Oscillospiraceae bacterium]|nr:ECF transporter S component [Oscillospiraceae bacterium]
MKDRKILFMTQFAILTAIEAIVCFTPLGSLPLGPLVATLSHIPVIIAAVMLGTGAGAGMGFMFGLFSFIVWSFMPPNPAMAFVFTPIYSFGEFSGNFWSILICFVPRILIGVVAGLTCKALKNRVGNTVTFAVSGVLGTLTNTVLVLGGIYIFFGRDYAEVGGVAYTALLGILGTAIITNGIPEAAIGGLVGSACAPLKRALNK